MASWHHFFVAILSVILLFEVIHVLRLHHLMSGVDFSRARHLRSRAVLLLHLLQ